MPGPMPRSSRTRPVAHELGDRRARLAHELRRTPVRAHRVVARAGEIEQRRIGLECLRDLVVVHAWLVSSHADGRHSVRRRRGQDEIAHLAASRGAKLSLAMLGDVLAAALAVGAVRVVDADPTAASSPRTQAPSVVDDPGGGQGAAVAAALAGSSPERSSS